MSVMPLMIYLMISLSFSFSVNAIDPTSGLAEVIDMEFVSSTAAISGGSVETTDSEHMSSTAAGNVVSRVSGPLKRCHVFCIERTSSCLTGPGFKQTIVDNLDTCEIFVCSTRNATVLLSTFSHQCAHSMGTVDLMTRFTGRQG